MEERNRGLNRTPTSARTDAKTSVDPPHLGEMCRCKIGRLPSNVQQRESNMV